MRRVCRCPLPGLSTLFRPRQRSRPTAREQAQRTLIDDLPALFGGRSQPVMAHLIESGRVSLGDVKEAEKALRKLAKEGKR